MNAILRTLILEDRTADSDRIVHELRRAGFDPLWVRIQTQADLMAQIGPDLDLILASDNSEAISIQDVLQLLHHHDLDIPLIVIRSRVGEEYAAEWIRQGASDVVPMAHIERLGQAVSIAQKEKGVRDSFRASAQALRVSEQRFRQLAENAIDVIFRVRFRPELEVEYISPSCAALTSYTPDEFYSHPELLVERVHPDDWPHVWPNVQITQPTLPFVFRWRCKDETIRWIEQQIVVLCDDEGIPVLVEGISRDITERKRAENEMYRINRGLQSLTRCSEVLARATDEIDLLQQMCDILVEVGGYKMAWVGFAEHDARRTIRPVAQSGFNDGYLTLVQVTWAENDPRGQGPGGKAIRSGQPVLQDITDDPSFAPWRETALLRGYRSIFVVPLQIDGQTIGALALYASEPDAFGEAERQLLKRLMDDTAYGIWSLRARRERRRAQESMQQSEARMRAIVSSLPIILLSFDAHGVITFSEGKGIELLLTRRLPLVGHKLTDIVELFGQIGTDYRAVFIGETLSRVVETPDHAVVDLRFLPMLDPHDNVVGGIAIAIDITERKLAETARQMAEQLNVELEQEKQLREMKDQLISTASHEFRTPLTTILSSASLLEVAGANMPPEKIQHHLRKIQNNVQNMNNLLEDVLTLNRADTQSQRLFPALIPLVSFCQGIIEELETTIGAGHHFELSTTGAPIKIPANEKLLRQVLINLITNAINYSPAGTTVSTALHFEERWVVIEVQDRGIGISEQDAPHVFETFYRGRNAARVHGTGLGLAIARHAVLAHGGTISFQSELHGGTIFKVALPLENSL